MLQHDERAARRARREARREEQRAQNVIRARQMHELRVEYETNNPPHDYSKEEIAVWTQRIKASGARGVWAYFNNDRDCYATKNALVLRRQLQKV